MPPQLSVPLSVVTATGKASPHIKLVTFAGQIMVGPAVSGNQEMVWSQMASLPQLS